MFESVGKPNLNSVGEQYGLLLALIQIIKNTYPQLKEGTVIQLLEFNLAISAKIEIYLDETKNKPTAW